MNQASVWRILPAMSDLKKTSLAVTPSVWAAHSQEPIPAMTLAPSTTITAPSVAEGSARISSNALRSRRSNLPTQPPTPRRLAPRYLICHPLSVDSAPRPQSGARVGGSSSSELINAENAWQVYRNGGEIGQACWTSSVQPPGSAASPRPERREDEPTPRRRRRPSAPPPPRSLRRGRGAPLGPPAARPPAQTG